MEVYTISFAVVFSILAFIVRPGTAVGLLVLSTIIWPEYLRFSVGIAQMSVPRTMAIAMVLSQILKGRASLFKFHLIDVLVILAWIWGVLASFIADGGYAPSRMIGVGLDTMVIYFAVRVSLTNFHELKRMIKPLLLAAFVMCGVSFMEAVFQYTPYRKLMAYRSWDFWQGMATSEFRLGFLRAMGSTNVPIVFGMIMMMVASLIWALRDYLKSKFIALLGFSTAILAALASLSSGPWIGCLFLVFFNAYYKRLSLIKPSLWGMLAVIVLAEFASNRHFYHLINYIGLSSGTAYYRTRLLEVMINHIDEFWFVGIEGKTTQHWIDEIGGQSKLDIVNHYLIIMYESGILALILYLTIHFLIIKGVITAFKKHCKYGA